MSIVTQAHVRPAPQNLDKKEAWNVAFEKYLRELDAKKPVIWTGRLPFVCIYSMC